MGCTACGSGKALASKSGNRYLRQPAGDCVYTIELMTIWKDKLLCIKNNNLFSQIGVTKYKINFALGTVQSALNTNDACSFTRQLDEINIIILALINSGECQ